MKRLSLLIFVIAALWSSPAEAQFNVDARSIYLGVTGAACRLQTGTGSPEGAVTAPVCAQYLNISDGKWWRKATGSGNTGWVLQVAPAGSDTQVQFNDGGAFGADSTFTFNKTTDTLGVNNIFSQTGANLAITGAAGTTQGRHVFITGGTSDTTAGAAGDVTIAGGSVIGGSSTTAGSATIKTGAVQFGHGTLRLTTGVLPIAYATPGDGIIIKPATPPTNTASGSGTLGIGVLSEGGPGQAVDNLFGNDLGGTGGPNVVKGGVGGNSLASGNTRTAGPGGPASLLGGNGGNATGSSGTRTGGKGGDANVWAGTGGTGASANGADGDIVVVTGANTRLLITGATGAWTVCGDVGTTGQVLTANAGACPSWENAGGGGGGSVTSVDLTVPSLLSVSGNPITTSGTFAVTWDGTEDLIPFFSDATTLSTDSNLKFTDGVRLVTEEFEITAVAPIIEWSPSFIRIHAPAYEHLTGDWFVDGPNGSLRFDAYDTDDDAYIPLKFRALSFEIDAPLTATGAVRTNGVFNVSGTDGLTRVCDPTAGDMTFVGGIMTSCTATHPTLGSEVAQLRREVAELRRLVDLLSGRGYR